MKKKEDILMPANQDATKNNMDIEKNKDINTDDVINIGQKIIEDNIDAFRELAQ
jgi:hypothetical protein